MAQKSPLFISFLWHMHQPWYLWDKKGEAPLPWVRLHALKDYYDMPLLAERLGFPMTINIVPSLMRQIELLACGEATDTFWEAFLPDMEDMDESQLNLVVTNFFSANYDRHINSSPRYKSLFAKKGGKSDWRIFSSQEIRDLQVHFILAWLGQNARESTEVKELLRKDKNYSADDKKFLEELINRSLKELIPYYSRIAQAGLIQVTMSPYYHPILPLLCDMSSARKANPLALLPHEPFIYPADAMQQVRMGMKYLSNLLGIVPDGMWPSEGSVSEEILPILIDAGMKYIFSDEDILRKSLEMSHGEPVELIPQRLYQPYRLHRGGSDIKIFFRDKRISDKIGFDYYNWGEDDALVDFTNSLMRIYDSLPPESGEHIVSIIMDGENAWEYYRDNGKPFLTKLYSKLLENPSIVPISFKDYLDRSGDALVLDRLAPGSWIAGDFSTWCGSQEKNRAWDILSKTRSHFHLNADRFSPAIRDEIAEHIMIAEGSDWFWWFGETNYTPHIDIFDALFRHHLRKVYQLMDTPIPTQLEEPIQIHERPFEPVRKPLQFMSPSLEGKATTYFEWSSAGFFKAASFRGSMSTSQDTILQRIFYGFDKENLFLRLDSSHHLINFIREGGEFILKFLAPKRIELEIHMEGEKLKWDAFDVEDDKREKTELVNIEVVCDQICEMRFPFSSIVADAENPIRLVVYARRPIALEQRFPPGGQYMQIVPPDESFEERMWYV